MSPVNEFGRWNMRLEGTTVDNPLSQAPWIWKAGPGVVGMKAAVEEGCWEDRRAGTSEAGKDQGEVRERTGKGRARTQGKAAEKGSFFPQKGLSSVMWDGEVGRAPGKRPGFQKVLRGLFSLQWTVMGIGVGDESSDWGLKDRYIFRKLMWCHEKNNVYGPGGLASHPTWLLRRHFGFLGLWLPYL